jgi:hypothetical protein
MLAKHAHLTTDLNRLKQKMVEEIEEFLEIRVVYA